MPTLRAMIDGKTLEFASPAAKHVAKNMTDPFGETKEDLDDLNQARMDYEMKKQNMRMKLAPVQQVVQGIKNMHQLDGPGDGSPLDMSPNNPNNMDMNDPNNGQQIDESTGLPINMTQTPGDQMNMNRPSQAGFQPGVSPGPQESVRPGKMGTPQAGQGNASTVAGNPKPTNMPAGWTKPGQGPGNQPGQYNKGAAPPKGNRSLPGAKGPGDPKVANRTKKAQSNSGGGSGRPIHVEVRADSLMTKPAASTVARAAASDALRHPIKAREFSQGKREKLAKTGAAMPHGGFPIVNREDLSNAKRAIGRAKNRTATIRHINERAKALGAPGFGKMSARMVNLTQ